MDSRTLQQAYKFIVFLGEEVSFGWVASVELDESLIRERGDQAWYLALDVQSRPLSSQPLLLKFARDETPGGLERLESKVEFRLFLSLLHTKLIKLVNVKLRKNGFVNWTTGSSWCLGRKASRLSWHQLLGILRDAFCFLFFLYSMRDQQHRYLQHTGHLGMR